jgi:amino acid transporter
VDARIFVVLNQVLLLLGVGFLIANALIVVEYAIYRRRKPGALLVWPRPKTPDYGLSLAIGVVLGCIVFYKLVYLHRPVFGEGMMFLYYAYLLPLSRTIRRGFYDEGIWADSNFVRYNEVGGISWREGEHRVTLIVISRLRNLARKLSVPLEHYAAARRLLRDKISAHDIQFAGTGLDLGARDERDEI